MSPFGTPARPTPRRTPGPPRPIGPPPDASRAVRRRRGASAAVALVVVAAGCAGGSGPPGAAPGPTTIGTGPGAPNATVTRVTDGDTIHVERSGRDETIRLIGIDTPETKKPDTAVECFGTEASAHLLELLPPGTPVRLERDVEERDAYDRTLAYVYLADGRFVNLVMAADGFAGQLTIPPNVAHAAEITEATRDARQRRAGLWAACGGNHVAARP